jgi:hypothetical protein
LGKDTLNVLIPYTMDNKNVELIKAYICEEFTKKHAKK